LVVLAARECRISCKIIGYPFLYPKEPICRSIPLHPFPLPIRISPQSPAAAPWPWSA
jgi:hypothetical protein